MSKINERCAGIDVGKRFLLCCVLTAAANEEPTPRTVRFDTTVAALTRLREWLLAMAPKQHHNNAVANGGLIIISNVSAV